MLEEKNTQKKCPPKKENCPIVPKMFKYVVSNFQSCSLDNVRRPYNYYLYIYIY